jgi:hypothetical protein
MKKMVVLKNTHYRGFYCKKIVERSCAIASLMYGCSLLGGVYLNSMTLLILTSQIKQLTMAEMK